MPPAQRKDEQEPAAAAASVGLEEQGADAAAEAPLASLAHCPALATVKATDDALRRQFTTDCAALRALCALPAMLGLTRVHERAEREV